MGSGYISPSVITDEVRIGSTSDLGSAKLQVTGGARIEDGLTVTSGVTVAGGVVVVGTPEMQYMLLSSEYTTTPINAITGGVFFVKNNKPHFTSDSGSGYIEYDLTSGITSIGLDLPTSVFSVSSTLTSNGTLTSSFISQTAAYVFAAPLGGAGIPSFRALDTSNILTGSFIAERVGSGTATSGYVLTSTGIGVTPS